MLGEQHRPTSGIGHSCIHCQVLGDQFFPIGRESLAEQLNGLISIVTVRCRAQLLSNRRTQISRRYLLLLNGFEQHCRGTSLSQQVS